MQNVPIGKLLIANGLLTQEKLQLALEAQKQSPGKRLGDILLEQGLVSEKDLMLALESRLRIKFVELTRYKINREAVNLIDEEYARYNKLIPIDIVGGALVVATAEPMDLYILEDLRLKTGYNIRPVLSTNSDIDDAIRIYYSTNSNQVSQNVDKEYSEQLLVLDELSAIDVENTPVVKYINTLIQIAVKIGASDIHIEPYKTKTKVRMRVDGQLFEQSEITLAAHQSLVTRLKIIAGMNIAERRMPQDGRVSFDIAERKIDVRVSSIPTVNGEKIALRILGGMGKTLTIGQLGLSAQDEPLFSRIIGLSHGMVLVCGPTGSGKTTTLYSILQEISDSTMNTITIEDPVEYEIPGVNQIQVNAKAGLTFATGLRSILRQDPDIIMVGEIRDEETAAIAVSASITGHIVLSTIHTNDAASVISRLTNMGIQPYFVSSSVAGIISQRLVKILCSHCKAKCLSTPHEMSILGLDEPVAVYQETGCTKCNFTGYAGRRGVFEILPVTARIREMIDAAATIDEIKRAAAGEGATTLHDSCLAVVLSGEISVKEYLKVTYTI